MDNTQTRNRKTERERE